MSPGTQPPRQTKAKWKASDAIAKRMDDLEELYAERDRIDAKCKAELADLVDGHGVPVAALSHRYGMERKTIYRHIGRSMA